MQTNVVNVFVAAIMFIDVKDSFFLAREKAQPMVKLSAVHVRAIKKMFAHTAGEGKRKSRKWRKESQNVIFAQRTRVDCDG